MYMIITCNSKSKDRPGKVTNPARGELRPCLNVQIESVHKICRQNLSKIKLCGWLDKLDATSWQVLSTTESVGWTDSN